MSRQSSTVLAAILNHFEYASLKYYKRELNQSRIDYFPLAWMTKDIRIMETFDRYPSFLPILNYLFNLTRKKGIEDYGGVKFDNKYNIGGKKYEYIDKYWKTQKREYATFTTNKDFYQKASSKLPVSEATIKKYLVAFRTAGIILEVGKAGRDGRIYSDGYYLKLDDNKYRKIPFLKKSPKFMKALRKFKLK